MRQSAGALSAAGTSEVGVCPTPRRRERGTAVGFGRLACVRQRTEITEPWGYRCLTARSGEAFGQAHDPLRLLKGKFMSLATILLIVLVLMLIGAVPSWPHSKNWGYGPSGGLGLVVLILVVLLLMGRI